MLSKYLGATSSKITKLRDLFNLWHWYCTLTHMVVFWGCASTFNGFQDQRRAPLVERIQVLRDPNYSIHPSNLRTLLCHSWILRGQHLALGAWYCIVIQFISLYNHWAIRFPFHIMYLLMFATLSYLCMYAILWAIRWYFLLLCIAIYNLGWTLAL